MLERPPVDRTSALRRARNKRHRERVREGRVTFTAEIDNVGINWMVQHHYLSESEASDARTLRESIGRAVTLLIKVSSR